MKEQIKNNFLKTNYSFFHDFKWYLLGSFVPLLIGFIKTPIFTSHFTKNDFGKLGLVQITFSFFAVFLFSWLSSCIWRYFESHNKNKTLNTLYSNIVFIYFIAIIIITIVSVIWIIISKNYLVKQLIFYGLINIIFSQFFIYYMIFVRLKGKANYYNTINSLKVITSFILALVLTFVLKLNIVSLIINLAIVDFLFFIYIILKNPINLNFITSKINKKQLITLTIYGSAGLIINFGHLALMSSDRYILATLSSIDSVGLYDQIYKLSYLLSYTVFLVFLNTISPTLNKVLESNFKKSEKIIEKYINFIFLFGLPIITYLSLFSKNIAMLLLGEKFRIGYLIMPYIFISSLLFVLINFFEMRLKFSNKLKKLILFVLLTTFLNIFLTVYLVPKYDIKGASIATLLSYAFLLFTLYVNDKKLYNLNKKNGILFFKISIILILEIVVYRYFQNQFELSFILSGSLILLFLIVYLLLLKKEVLKLDIPMINSFKNN